jgi:voltage-gated potassium channel
MARDLYHFERTRSMRLSVCFFLLLTVLTVGTSGYYWIEQWPLSECLYMTAITVSTVGFQEVHPLSREGHIFTVALIFFGVTAAALSLSAMFEYFILSGLSTLFGRKKMDKQISKLSRHIIICGYGRTGYYIARDLKKARRSFIVIDNDPERIKLLEQEGILFLDGDAQDEELLERAGICKAKALVAALANDADNLFLTLSARSLSDGLHIIARVEDPDSGHKFMKAGASRVVSPFSTGANRIVQLLTRPAAVDLIEVVGAKKNLELEVLEIDVEEGSKFAGKTLAEARVRQALGCLVFAVKRPNGETIFDPDAGTRLESGDVLVGIQKPKAHA